MACGNPDASINPNAVAAHDSLPAIKGREIRLLAALGISTRARPLYLFEEAPEQAVEESQRSWRLIGRQQHVVLVVARGNDRLCRSAGDL